MTTSGYAEQVKDILLEIPRKYERGETDKVLTQETAQSTAGAIMTAVNEAAGEVYYDNQQMVSSSSAIWPFEIYRAARGKLHDGSIKKEDKHMLLWVLNRIFIAAFMTPVESLNLQKENFEEGVQQLYTHELMLLHELGGEQEKRYEIYNDEQEFSKLEFSPREPSSGDTGSAWRFQEGAFQPENGAHA